MQQNIKNNGSLKATKFEMKLLRLFSNYIELKTQQ